METIIQQIAQKFTQEITKKACSQEMRNLDALATELLGDCKAAARELLEAAASELNLQIRKDKAGRKEQGLVLKEPLRPRKLVTELGELNLKRDYYWNKTQGKYVAVLDHVIGIKAYERVGDSLKAKLVELATEVSYGKSAAMAGEGQLSRQTVRNYVLKLPALEKDVAEEQKRVVKELHVYADEDHVHLQKPGKAKGKKNRIVPIVTVTEGIKEESKGRNRTIEPMHFVEESFDPKALWSSVEGYIKKRYDVEKLEKLYLHGDGGAWIKTGLEGVAQRQHVMDGYHLEKRLKDISGRYPKKQVGVRLKKAIKGNDRSQADSILQRLYEEEREAARQEYIMKLGTYLMGNWDSIVARMTLEIPGSCTEGQVSHVLSERFSRDPQGWSEEGLGKLSKHRVYVKNGGKIKGRDFQKSMSESYKEYAERMLEESLQGAFDWSLFEPQQQVFDGASGTQTLIQGMGSLKNTLFH